MSPEHSPQSAPEFADRTPRILIARLSAIGDCILTMPLAVALRRAFPGAFIAWAVEGVAGTIVEKHSAIDLAIRLPRRFARSAGGLWSLRGQLRSLCFDVGAHAGNRVRCWRQLGARVVAIEPQPDFVRLLRWLYGGDAGVEIVPQAVARSAGYADLLLSERTPTVTTLSQAWVDNVQHEPGFEHVKWSRRERVEVVTLESLVELYGEPAFVKIDVEGFEPEVISGMSRLLEKKDAPDLICEVCLWLLERRNLDTLSITRPLARFGYCMFPVTNLREEVDPNRIVPDLVNLYCTKRGRHPMRPLALFPKSFHSV